MDLVVGGDFAARLAAWIRVAPPAAAVAFPQGLQAVCDGLLACGEEGRQDILVKLHRRLEQADRDPLVVEWLRGLCWQINAELCFRRLDEAAQQHTVQAAGPPAAGSSQLPASTSAAGSRVWGAYGAVRR